MTALAATPARLLAHGYLLPLESRFVGDECVGPPCEQGNGHTLTCEVLTAFIREQGGEDVDG